MKRKIIFIVLFLVYLIVCYYHFRWEKYYDEYFAAAYDPDPLLTLEVSTQTEKAIEHLKFEHKSTAGRFVAYNNGVVWDKKTGLKWIAGPDTDTTWIQAKQWVENLAVDKGGWRMPTIAELRTLYQEGAGPHNMTPLLKASGGYVWSVETKEGGLGTYGYLFDDVDEHWGYPTTFVCRAFAVRSRK